MLPRPRFAIVTLLALWFAVTISANASSLSSPSSAQSSFTLSATPSQVAPSGQLTVNWTAPSGRPANDWIALYKVGDANTTYGSWQYTQGATSGSFAVTAPAQSGRYEFRYILQNTYTDIARSNIVPVTAAPSISITSPSNNSTFNAPTNITINATASDTDGISKVEFFQGTTKLGESAASPYSFVWNNAPGGSVALTAKATDSLGAVTTSGAVNITVNPAPGSISGTVTRLDGTTAIAGATIKAYQGTTLSAPAATNGTGNYTITALANATYSVEASAAGYETNTLAGVTVANGATTTLNITLSVPVTYIYDELGRLVAVIDKDGNAAAYAYDSVGNLLSISRQSPAQVSIIGFNPNSGPAGASVNIYGTGFSATAGQNTVTFNGTAANVVAASTTLVVVNVPSGATTGPIGITSPTGSATSSTSFIIGTGASGAPTITSFTPTIGASTTAVTITGTNFDTTIANDRVSFNVMRSTLSAASGTSITTSVPINATSGRISVATPSGKATSSVDFFAPPSPYAAGDVVFTGRMAIGENRTLTISTANKIGLMLFDGVVGQRVSLNIVPVSISSSYESIYNPNGTILLSTGFVGTSGKFIDTFVLPMTGTYTILINPQQNTGSITLSLYNIVDLSGTISPGGSSVPLLFSLPGQNASLTFTGTQGNRISLLVSSVTTTGNGSHTITVYKPDGTTLASIYDIATNVFLDTQTLPSSGTYTIVANPAGSATGNWTLTLYNVPADVVGTITPGGGPLGITITIPGQNAKPTFSGTTGQRVSLNVTAVTLGTSYVSIYNPDGTTLVGATTVTTSGKFIDALTLPATGTYTILEDPSGSYVGGATLTLYNVADISGTITPSGAPVTSTITTPGQNARYTFTGASGQRISLLMTSVTMSCNVNIYKPDGTILNGYYNPGNGAFIDAQTLPAAGTYTILVDPFFANTGSVTLTLSDVVDFSGSTTVGGGSISVTLNAPGQNGQVTFSGTSGQQVTVRVTTNTIAGVTVKLLKPDGSQLTASYSSSSSFNLPQQTLPTSGPYTIVIDPNGANTGSMNVSITSP
jgi:YD repeat-containing protein